MVKKIFTFLHKEISGLHQAAYLLGFFAFMSQILGLIRDRMLAHHFGAGEALDVYYASFRIPDFIFVTIASLASLSVLVPLLIEKMNKEPLEGKRFIQSIFSFFFTIIVITSALAWILLPYILPKIFPGITGENFEELLKFSRILLLSPILLGISNIYASVTQALGRFLIYALSPILYNAGIIIGLVFLAPTWGLSGVIYGVLIGAFLHMAIQIPFLAKEGFLPKFSYKFHLKSALHVFGLSIPRTIALAATHVSVIALISLASLLETGSIAIFNLSFNLQSVPLSIIGVSYSLAAFPTLSRFFAESKMREFLEHLIISLRHIIFWSVPAAVLFIVLRAQIVRTVLGSGEFTWDATRLTAATLALFVLSAVFQGVVLLLVRAFYAVGKTTKPLLVNIFSALVTIFSAYGFVTLFASAPSFRFFIEHLFRVEGVPGTEVLGLALGFTVGSILNGVILWLLCRNDFGPFTRYLRRTIFEIVSASILMGFTSYLMLNLLDNVFDVNTLIGIFLQGFIAGIVGIVVAIIILKLLKSRELSDMKSSLSKRLFGAAVVGPDAEVI